MNPRERERKGERGREERDVCVFLGNASDLIANIQRDF